MASEIPTLSFILRYISNAIFSNAPGITTSVLETEIICISFMFTYLRTVYAGKTLYSGLHRIISSFIFS